MGGEGERSFTQEVILALTGVWARGRTSEACCKANRLWLLRSERMESYRKTQSSS